jgi:hypothetical protein
VKPLFCLVLSWLLVITTVHAQVPTASNGAANPVQVSPPERSSPPSEIREVKIPAGTPLEIEAAYTVNSLDVRPEDLISFRVVVPVKVDGVTAIERYALVTGRVVQAKRGGHWGRAGKLSWIMQDVVAVDLTRVPVQARTDNPGEQHTVKGTSHAGQVATEMIVFGSLMWVIAPVVLIHGFKRGENAVLPEGKRFIIFVKNDTQVRAAVEK